MSSTPPVQLPSITNLLMQTNNPAVPPIVPYDLSFQIPGPKLADTPPITSPVDTPPKPKFVTLPNRQVVGIRCVCGEAETDCLLVPCVQCGYYVHGRCVCVPRVTDTTKCVCPFCSGHKIRCTCEQPMKFDEPLIQCTKCKFWMHKACAGFLCGRDPDEFICFKCGFGKYHLPPARFSEKSLCRNAKTTWEGDREELVAKIPDGEFKDEVMDTLEKSEFDFRETMITYIEEFAPCLFDFTKEFWKIFVGTLSTLLSCEKKDVMDAIDELITNMFFKEPTTKQKTVIPGLAISDAIAGDIADEKLPKFDTFPESIPISLTEDGRVIAEKEVGNGGFICEIPGLLCHEEEIKSGKGIPRSVIGIPDTRIVVDVSRSSNPILKHIRRSFTFNCEVKLVRVNGAVKVALYGTKLRGMLSDEKTMLGSSIAAGGELLIPLDVSIPYPVDKPFWKVKKAKQPANPKKPRVKVEKKPPDVSAPKQPKKKRVPQTTESRAMKTRARAEFPVTLTLLSSFQEDACPPMPIILKNQREIDEENPDPGSLRGRIRERHNRHIISGSD